jgi:sterol 3beta-glucosyltransferase
VKLTLITIGSRGDVQPFLALGRALAAAGHEPWIATHPRFEPLVDRAELRFAPIAEGATSVGPETAAGRRWMQASSRFLPTWVGFLQDATSVAGQRLSDALSACRDSDAIIASELATIVGWQMAEHFDRPLVLVRLNLPVRVRNMRPVIRRAVWRATRFWLDGVRREHGLPALPATDPIRALDASHAPVLRAYSPAVGSMPAPDREWIHVTGYWFLDRQLDPEPGSALREFLAAGPPPVCLDFGSMLDADPDATTRLVVEVLERAGRRGILIRGRYRNSDVPLPPTILGLDAAPHDWLLKRCSVVVHHAGAGTTAAALAAGTPSVTVPHTAEQQRWARRLHAIGVATAPIPRRRLTVQALYGAVAAAAEDPALSANAAVIGATVRDEDGVANALRALEHHLDTAAEAIGCHGSVGAR